MTRFAWLLIAAGVLSVIPMCSCYAAGAYEGAAVFGILALGGWFIAGAIAVGAELLGEGIY